MKIIIVVAILLSSCLALASEDQAQSISSSEVSEEEFVDIMLGEKEGPNSPFMTIRNESETPEFTPEAGVDMAPYFTVVDREDWTADILAREETAAIRRIINEIHSFGKMAYDRGRKVLAVQYSIPQAEANSLYRWALLMLDKRGEFLSANQRKLCGAYFDEQETPQIEPPYRTAQKAMMETSVEIHAVWKTAESELATAVSASTYKIVTERIAAVELDRGTHKVTAINYPDYSLEDEMADFSEWCAHVLSQPE